jgi:hypothetical protein
VLDVFHGQQQLVGVALWAAAEFATVVGEYLVTAGSTKAAKTSEAGLRTSMPASERSVLVFSVAMDPA